MVPSQERCETSAPRPGSFSEHDWSLRSLLPPSLTCLVVALTLGVLSWQVHFAVDAAAVIVPTSAGAGLAVRQALTLRDRARLARRLSRREEHYRSLLAASSDVIAVCDSNGVITYCSPAISTVLGYEPEYLVGGRLIDGVHLEDVRDVMRRIGTLVRGDVSGSVRFGCRVRDVRGRWLTIESTVTDHRDNPSVRGLVFNLRDVTDRTELEWQLSHVVHHDPLTDLPNRKLFRAQLSDVLVQRRVDHPPAVLVLDLDGFKAVNEAAGHAIGDEVLVMCAERIRAVVRGTDTVARLDGDAFAVLLEEATGEFGAVDVADRLLTAVSAPYVINGKEHVIGACIGIAYATSRTGADELVVDAELALRVAKRTGRGRVEVFEPAMHSEAVRRVELEADMRRALVEEEFTLEYQPIFRLTDREITGVEALVRWHHPQRGVMQPAEFISVAEESGLIVRLGRWVVEESCRQLARWRRAGFEIAMSVNLSARQIAAPGLVDLVAAALRSSGVPASALTLEITENILIDTEERTLAKLHLLRELGIQLAIDDFGTGYSSLSYLQRLPVDVLKIDRSYVTGVGTQSELTTLTAAIVRLAEELGLTIVAEGIEQQIQIAGLAAMGCQLGQGFLYAAPLPAAEMTELLRARAAFPRLVEPIRLRA